MTTRNMRERIPAGPGSGRVIAGSRYVGLLGSDILAATGSGDDGPGIFVPWAPEPANRYRALVTAVSGGPLTLREDGSGAADNAFIAMLTVYEYAAGSTASPNVWRGVQVAAGAAAARVEATCAFTETLTAAIGAQVQAAADDGVWSVVLANGKTAGLNLIEINAKLSALTSQIDKPR